MEDWHRNPYWTSLVVTCLLLLLEGPHEGTYNWEACSLVLGLTGILRVAPISATVVGIRPHAGSIQLEALDLPAEGICYYVLLPRYALRNEGDTPFLQPH